VSDQIMDIFHRYDPDMCPAGCDEGYLKCVFVKKSTVIVANEDNSITPYCEEHSTTAEECVKEMRETVFRETKLTVSAGIAPNKVSYALDARLDYAEMDHNRCSQKYVVIFLILFYACGFICIPLDMF
jgi:nucleotidyltransferase/DNA polymerase involved in DNA repair